MQRWLIEHLVAVGDQQELELEHSGARILAPAYQADRLRQARRRQQRRLTPMLIWAVFMMIGGGFFAVTQLQMQQVGWFLFGVAALAGAGWLGWRHWRQARSRGYGLLITPRQVQGLRAGTLVTVTGTVQHGDQTGHWGDPRCVWTAIPSSSLSGWASGGAVSVCQSGGYVWLGDEGGSPEVIADFSHATTGQIGYPGDVEAQACAWAICVGDRISVTGILSWTPQGVAVIGQQHRTLFSGGEWESSVDVGHPLTDQQPTLAATPPGQPDLARGGRVGPQVVVLPPELQLRRRLGLRIG